MIYRSDKDTIDSSLIDSIIKFLEKKNKSSFGDIVKNINASYYEVLKHVLHLKQNGIINKIQSPEGYYQISKTIKS